MLILLKLYFLLFQESAQEGGDRSYRSHMQFRKPLLSFRLQMGSTDRIQADRLVQQMSYMRSHLSGPLFLIVHNL